MAIATMAAGGSLHEMAMFGFVVLPVVVEPVSCVGEGGRIEWVYRLTGGDGKFVGQCMTFDDARAIANVMNRNGIDG